MDISIGCYSGKFLLCEKVKGGGRVIVGKDNLNFFFNDCCTDVIGLGEGKG